MKKILFTAALFVTFGLVSCGNDPEAKAEEFAEKVVEATKNGDFTKVIEIQKEEQAYINSLSKEEQQAYAEAATKVGEKYAKELMGM